MKALKFKTALGLSALFASFFLVAPSCQKEDDTPATNQPLNYALQVIPDIHEVIPLNLVQIMDSIGALHFGDNPPQLQIDSLGFAKKPAIIYDFIKADTSTLYSLSIGEPKFYNFFFKFSDQHRGIAKYDFKCQYIDSVYYGVYHEYYIEYAKVEDFVFIMGDGAYFTAYFHQNRQKESSSPTIVDFGAHEASILSGQVTSTGIKDFYYGMTVTSYDNPAGAGTDCLNINDIVIFYMDFLPFKYWDPSIHYN